MDIKELFEKRDTRLRWAEPWEGLDNSGNPVVANVILSATVQDCINMQRHLAITRWSRKEVLDFELLSDFITIHWAWEEKDGCIRSKTEKG